MNIITNLIDRFSRAPRGKIRVMSINELGEPQKIISKPNLILYGGADFMAKALGNSGKKLAYMYFEFTNAGGSTPVITPTRDQGVNYYNSLASPADYLRVPIVMDPVYSATSNLYLNNSVMFSAMTAGYTQGVHGTQFQQSSGSQIYGVALAYTGAQDIPTQDVVFSRSYFTPSQSITKLNNQQVAAYWAIEFL